MENLYLTLPSNTIDVIDNKPSQFRVRLQNPLDLNGEWEMALVEIQYPHSWDNITKKKTDFGVNENEFYIRFGEGQKKRRRGRRQIWDESGEYELLPTDGGKFLKIPAGDYDDELKRTINHLKKEKIGNRNPGGRVALALLEGELEGRKRAREEFEGDDGIGGDGVEGKREEEEEDYMGESRKREKTPSFEHMETPPSVADGRKITDEVLERIPITKFEAEKNPRPPSVGVKQFVVRYTIPPGSYDTEPALVETINKVVGEWNFSKNDIKRENPGILTDEEADEIVSSYKKFVKITPDPFVLIKHLPDNHRIKLEVKKGVSAVFFSPTLQYILGLATSRWVFLEEAEFIAKYPPDLSGGFNTFYIYCSLIEPQIVGNTCVPLLRTVTIEGKHGDYINKTFFIPHYLKLRTNRFDSVEIAIKTDTNELVNFNFGKVILKIHLRKVQNPL